MCSKSQEHYTDKLELFAARLKSAMSRKGVVLREVAEAVGKGISTVGSWTQGKNWPETDSLILLSDFLGVSLDFLVSGKSVNSELEPVVTEYPENKEGHVLAEPKSTHGTPETLTAEIRRLFGNLLRSAENDVGRLGWIREQVLHHLEAPEHWNLHEQVMKQVLEERRLKDEAEAEAQRSRKSGGGVA